MCRFWMSTASASTIEASGQNACPASFLLYVWLVWRHCPSNAVAIAWCTSNVVQEGDLVEPLRVATEDALHRVAHIRYACKVATMPWALFNLITGAKIHPEVHFSLFDFHCTNTSLKRYSIQWRPYPNSRTFSLLDCSLPFWTLGTSVPTMSQTLLQLRCPRGLSP
jgi:hypothetical protein